jgi:hypothetical protein
MEDNVGEIELSGLLAYMAIEFWVVLVKKNEPSINGAALFVAGIGKRSWWFMLTNCASPWPVLLGIVTCTTLVRSDPSLSGDCGLIDRVSPVLFFVAKSKDG